jgi:Ca2+-transporting ATPase
MQRPPRPPAQSVLGDGLWRRILAIGTLVTIVSLGVAVWTRHDGRPWQTMLFFTLATAQFGVALGVRARPGTWQNPFLLFAVTGAFALQLLAVYAAPVRTLLGTKSLSVGQIAGTVAVAVVSYLATRLFSHR